MGPLALPLLMALSPQVFLMSQRTLLVAPVKDNDEMRSIVQTFICVAPTGSFGAASSPDRLSSMDRKLVLTTRRRTTAATFEMSPARQQMGTLLATTGGRFTLPSLGFVASHVGIAQYGPTLEHHLTIWGTP